MKTSTDSDWRWNKISNVGTAQKSPGSAWWWWKHVRGNDWKRLVQLRIHINARVGLQNRPFFSFWIWFTIFENLKTTSYSHILEYYLSNFWALFHFRPMFRFYTGVAFITFAKNRFRYYFFLSTNIENISIYFEDY